MNEFKKLLYDIKRIIGKRKQRVFILPFNRCFVGILLYRIERFLFKIFGKFYPVVRVPLAPIFSLMQAYSNIDIHYHADIKEGLLILHPSAGVVISGKSRIGRNLTLTGGNIIGLKHGCNKSHCIEIGDNCTLGANATVIGPLKLGNNIFIGANACVVKSYKEDNIILVGVPARKLNEIS